MHPRQVPCWITHTNERTHAIIRAGLDRSPMYSGVIKGVGPRYCPSIEDKVVRFAQRDSHQIFLEPEGLAHARDLSQRNLHVPALRRAARPGALDARLRERAHPAPRLRHRIRLFRSARAEGLARDQGDRAACSSPGRSTGRPATRRRRRKGCWPASTPRCTSAAEAGWCPRRDEAYLGVLVDDLITRGVSEPYRMFTSRAEYRLQLREDNADLRLTEHGRRLGLVDDARWDAFSRKRDAIARRDRTPADDLRQPQCRCPARCGARSGTTH